MKKNVYNINDVQSLLLSLIRDVTRICEDKKIDYYLVKGGLIGAVRHNGFIPWDPDVDIVILRKDIQRFCDELRHNLSDPFELYYFDMQSDYEYLFPRVGIKGVDYRRLHLDVFILTEAPDTQTEQNRFFNIISLYEKLNTLRNSNIFRPVNSIFNRAILVISKLALCWIPKSFVRNKYLEYISKYKNQTNFVLQVGAVDEYGKKYLMPRKWFEESVYLTFEDIKLRAPKEYDLYLKQMYKDYMRLPDEKEQSKINNTWSFSNDEAIVRCLNKNK